MMGAMNTGMRSGRTTRMLEQATDLAKDGQHVYVMVAAMRDLEYMRPIIMRFLDGHGILSASRSMVRLPCGGSIEFFHHQDYMRGRQGTVLVDHAVTDTRLSRLNMRRTSVLHRELTNFMSAPLRLPPEDHWDIELHGTWVVSNNRKPTRESRYDTLRAEGRTLGEINQILEQEGFSEVSGEGVMPFLTKQHQIIRDNKVVKRMIQKGEFDAT